MSNHRSAIDDLKDCAQHIQAAVPNTPQRVEYLLESITCQDNSLQAAMGNVRADTNNMRSDFESASNHLIEVDPYKKLRSASGKSGSANVSSVTFAGRGKTGVDLCWHSRPEFQKLTDEQKDELREWQQTGDGKKALAASKKEAAGSKRKRGDGKGKDDNSGSWKKKFKKALKTPHGISHIMSVLQDEESNNSGLISALQPASLPPAPSGAPTPAPSAPPPAASSVAAIAAAFPALSTKVKLNGILKNGKSDN